MKISTYSRASHNTDFGDKKNLCTVSYHVGTSKNRVSVRFYIYYIISVHRSALELTPLVIFLCTPYDKHITKWLFWNCQKSHNEVSLLTFSHLFISLSRVPEPKLVVISPLALKWQIFKVEALIFFLYFTT